MGLVPKNMSFITVESRGLLPVVVLSVYVCAELQPGRKTRKKKPGQNKTSSGCLQKVSFLLYTTC